MIQLQVIPDCEVDLPESKNPFRIIAVLFLDSICSNGKVFHRFQRHNSGKSGDLARVGADHLHAEDALHITLVYKHPRKHRNGIPQRIAPPFGNNADTFIPFQAGFIVAVQPADVILNTHQLILRRKGVVRLHGTADNTTLLLCLSEQILECNELLLFRSACPCLFFQNLFWKGADAERSAGIQIAEISALLYLLPKAS